MSFLDEFLTEQQVVDELRKRTGVGTRRTLRSWRGRRVGPPWVKFGKIIIYPSEQLKTWFHNQVQHPVRSQKRT